MATSLMVMLAFFNGLMIVTTRVVNARLGLHISSAGSSFWNHFIGFFSLVILSPILFSGMVIEMKSIPVYLFLGGLIGALYVTINSLVIPRIGASKTTVLVIAGQIVIGTIIDIFNGSVSNVGMTIIGISLVVVGMWIGNQKKETDLPLQILNKVSK